MRQCLASLHQLIRGTCVRLCAPPCTPLTATYRPPHNCAFLFQPVSNHWVTGSSSGGCSSLAWYTGQPGQRLYAGSAAVAAVVPPHWAQPVSRAIATAAAAPTPGAAPGAGSTARAVSNKTGKLRQQRKQPDAAMRIAKSIGSSHTAAAGAAASGKLPAAGLRKTPSVTQQQHAEAVQPTAGEAVADEGNLQAAGSGQPLLVGREEEIFQAAMEAMPPQAAQTLLQAATQVARRNQLPAADVSQGLLSVLALYKEMPNAVDLPTLLTPRVIHMQNSLLVMTARQLRRVLPSTQLTGPLLGQDARKVSQHIAYMVHTLWSELGMPMPTSYLKPRQLSMLLRTPVIDAKHLLSTLRGSMGQEQAARLLQERPNLLFHPHAVVAIVKYMEHIAAVYGVSKVQAMWLGTSHKSLTYHRLMRLELWQEELQAGLGLGQQQLMQVLVALPLLLTYPSTQDLLVKLRTLQQLAPSAPQHLLLQLLSQQPTVRHKSAASLSDSLQTAAAILDMPVDAFIPWLMKRAGGSDNLDTLLYHQQEQAPISAIAEAAADSDDSHEVQDPWLDPTSFEVTQQGEQEQEQHDLYAAPEDVPTTESLEVPVLDLYRVVNKPIGSLLRPASDLKERSEQLCQVFNTTPVRLAGILRIYPTLLAWDPLTVGIKLTALSSTIMGGPPTKEAARQLAQLLTRCPQVLGIRTQSVVGRAKLLQERLRLGPRELQALLLRQPQLLLLREERLTSSLEQLQALLPQGEGAQLRKVVMQQPAVLALWGRPTLAPSHPRMQFLAHLLRGTPAADPQALLAACLGSPAGPTLLSLTAEALAARLDALAAVTGQSQAQLLQRLLKPNCNFGRVLSYSPQRVLLNAQVLGSLLHLNSRQAAALLSKAPVLLQYNSDTLAAKALELAPGFAAAQQQLREDLEQQAALGRAPGMSSSAAAPLGQQEGGADQGLEPSWKQAGLPLLAAAAVVRPEVLGLDSKRTLRRLQRLVTLVAGRSHWQQELLGALDSGRVAQWLVMADERLERLEVLQHPSAHPAAAAAAAAPKRWSIMHVLTLSEASWSSGRKQRPQGKRQRQGTGQVLSSGGSAHGDA